MLHSDCPFGELSVIQQSHKVGEVCTFCIPDEVCLFIEVLPQYQMFGDVFFNVIGGNAIQQGA